MATATDCDPDFAAVDVDDRSGDARPLISAIAAAVAHHPSFQVRSIDGHSWIDPYTGYLVAIPDQGPGPGSAGAADQDASARRAADAALSYLVAQRPWRGAQLRGVQALQLFRWRIFLSAQLSRDPRLALFTPQGRWLNPCTGEPTSLRVRGGLHQRTVLEMARILADCPQAQAGVLLPEARLQARLRELRSTASAIWHLRSTRITTRVSGPRAGQVAELVAQTPTLGPSLAEVEDILAGMHRPLPTIPGFGLASYHEPVSDVGGDFYDCCRLDERQWLIVLGDVVGHDLESARYAALALRHLRAVLPAERALPAIITRLNHEMRAVLPRGRFVTLFAALLDGRTGRLSCLCAGHHPALLLRRGARQEIRAIGAPGPALGLFDTPSFTAALRPVACIIDPGDLLFLYTDGLSEVRDDLSREFGQDGVVRSLATHLRSPYDQLVERVVGEARQFADGALEDDITVLALSLEAQRRGTTRTIRRHRPPS